MKAPRCSQCGIPIPLDATLCEGCRKTLGGRPSLLVVAISAISLACILAFLLSSQEPTVPAQESQATAEPSRTAEREASEPAVERDLQGEEDPLKRAQAGAAAESEAVSDTPVAKVSGARPAVAGEQVQVARGDAAAFEAAIVRGGPIAASRIPSKEWLFALYHPWQGEPPPGMGDALFIKTIQGGAPVWDMLLFEPGGQACKPILAGFPAQEITWSSNVRGGFREMKADGIPLQWNGSRLDCKMNRVRSKKFVPQYVACLGSQDLRYSFAIRAEGPLSADFDGDGIADIALPLEGQNRFAPADRVTRLVILRGDVSGFVPAVDQLIGINERAVSVGGMDFSDASSATGLARRILRLSLVGGKIIAEAKTFTEQDKPCCPTGDSAIEFSLSRDGLVEAAFDSQQLRPASPALPQENP